MKRINSLNLIKIFSAIFVFYIHFFNRLQINKLGFSHKTTILLVFFYTIFLSCVPLFFMISGSNLKNRISNKSHYLKIVYFISQAVFFTLIGRTLASIFILNNFNFSDLPKWLFSPAYFVTYYIFLYLLAPSLNKLSEKIEYKEVLVFIFVITAPSLLNLINNVKITSFTFSLYPILYYILGYYIVYNKDKILIKYNRFYGLIKIIILSSLNVLFEYLLFGRKLYSIGLGTYSNIFVIFISIEIFKFFLSINIKEGFFNKIIEDLSKQTLAFYLIGIYFADSMSFTILPTIPKNIVLSIIQSPINLIISFSISYIISKIYYIFENLLIRTSK